MIMIGFDRLGTFFAKFSYSTYLIHMGIMIILMNGVFTSPANCNMSDRAYFGLVVDTPMFDMFDSVNIKSFGLYLVSVSLAFGASYVFYLMFERFPEKRAKWMEMKRS